MNNAIGMITNYKVSDRFQLNSKLMFQDCFCLIEVGFKPISFNHSTFNIHHSTVSFNHSTSIIQE